MTKKVKIHRLNNGLTLVMEPHREVSSGAFCFLVPAGSAVDPPNRSGTTEVLTEWAFRGAGDMDNRTLNQKLDCLGLHHSSHVSSLHSSHNGALVSDKLIEAIDIHAQVLRHARLEEADFGLCRELALQNLDSLEDDPRQKISLLIQEYFFPDPMGRPSCGKREELQQLTVEETRQFYRKCYSPHGAILAVAGKIDQNQVIEAVERCFGDWQGNAPDDIPQGQCRSGYTHQANEGAQVHIGILYPSVNCTDNDYYHALAAVSILSGGMGSRLFTEVRQKRGLCYAVGASHNVNGPYGAVRCYVGSQPDKAQQALDVTLDELNTLSNGITDEELDRAKIGLRASLIMQGESTSMRAMACARDAYYLNRVRSLEEIENAILALSPDAVLDHVRRHPAGRIAVATIGPTQLNVKFQ